MRVIWSPLALARVVEIADRIRWDKPGAADRWVERLFGTVDTLVDSPRRCRKVPELDRPDVRELLFGNYRVIYRIEEGALVVLTVRHGRQLLDLDEVR
jgi:plasmid stabilization system protein ParE